MRLIPTSALTSLANSLREERDRAFPYHLKHLPPTPNAEMVKHTRLQTKHTAIIFLAADTDSLNHFMHFYSQKLLKGSGGPTSGNTPSDFLHIFTFRHLATMNLITDQISRPKTNT